MTQRLIQVSVFYAFTYSESSVLNPLSSGSFVWALWPNVFLVFRALSVTEANKVLRDEMDQRYTNKTLISFKKRKCFIPPGIKLSVI